LVTLVQLTKHEKAALRKNSTSYVSQITLLVKNIADISTTFYDEDDNVVEKVIHRVRAQRARQQKE
jgi:hypothetical protein